MAVKTLEEAIAEAGLMPVSWAKCLCRRCGEFRLSLPPMKRKRQQIACPRCGKAIWVEENARGGVLGLSWAWGKMRAGETRPALNITG